MIFPFKILGRLTNVNPIHKPEIGRQKPEARNEKMEDRRQNAG